jgi:alpha-beta hydrolase superfamily lysophospholipase
MKHKSFFKIIKIFFIIYVTIGVILYFTQEYFLFHGKKLPTNYAFSFKQQKFEELNVTRKDGSNLNLVKFKPSDSTMNGIVIYYHGNRVNITRYAAYIQLFLINGYEVWMMDYPGFGKTTGKRTESRMKEDAKYVYDLATKQITADSIILYGKSMGTGLASYIAANNKCKRLLLETPYYSLPTVYDDFTFIYPTKWMLRFQFPSYENMPKILAPITIFHGTKDALISYKNASRLKPLLKPIDEFVTIENAGHNNILNFQLYTDKLDSILSLP